MGARLRATGPIARAAALGVLLFLVYASTLGLDAFLDSDYGGDEPHYLLAAESLLEEGDVDVLDEYESEDYAGFYPYELDMHGTPDGETLHEPHGVGFPLLILPAFAAAGAIGVELLLAALAAACGVVGYLLARRVVPDPWALGAALSVGLSPPFLAYGSAVYPELAAGAALAGAALLALRLRESPKWVEAVGCGALLAVLPWLGTKFVPAGVVVGAFAVWSLRAQGRRLPALACLQVIAASAIAYVLVNQATYGGPTPYAADVAGESATDASSVAAYLGRSYRLAALLIDRDYGLMRWAPVFALAAVGAWVLLRRRGPRDDRNRSMIDSRARTAALLCAGVVAVQLLVAAFLAPTMFGFWFPPRHLLAGLPLAVPLVALGLRRLPRTGGVLAAIGVAGSVWVWLAVRLGDAGLAADRPEAPFGPLDVVLPYYGESPVPYVLTAAAAAVLLAIAARAYADRVRAASRQARHTAGVTRRRYSG